jgi:hypothetical protein
MKGAPEMTHRSIWVKLVAIVLSILTFMATGSYSMAETSASSPLGTILASNPVMIGNSAAPTGTTIFPGDRVTSNEQAVIDLNNGSRIEITRATVDFTRQGKRIVIKTDPGLLRFCFKQGEEVQINAGEYGFTTVGNSRHVGALGFDRRGQIAMNVSEGAFAVFNRAAGTKTEVNPNIPLVVMVQSGEGSISKSGQSLTDNALALIPNALSAKCIVVGKEAHSIAANSQNTITIEGTWELKTGKYAYKVVDCTEEAMIQAGASAAAAKNAVMLDVFGSAPAKESHASRNAAVIVGIGAAAVAVPLAIKTTNDEEKSPSSR